MVQFPRVVPPKASRRSQRRASAGCVDVPARMRDCESPSDILGCAVPLYRPPSWAIAVLLPPAARLGFGDVCREKKTKAESERLRPRVHGFVLRRNRGDTEELSRRLPGEAFGLPESSCGAKTSPRRCFSVRETFQSPLHINTGTAFQEIQTTL